MASVPSYVCSAVSCHLKRSVMLYIFITGHMHSYKEDITSEQKDALLQLIRRHGHYKITEEVRREIIYSRSRDNEVPMEVEA